MPLYCNSSSWWLPRVCVADVAQGTTCGILNQHQSLTPQAADNHCLPETYVLNLNAPSLFPVGLQPTVYVADSVLATNAAGSDGSSSGLLVTVTGATLALAGAAAALIALSSSTVETVKPVAFDGPSLSFYVKKFEGEVAPAPAAPAVKAESEAEIVAAPVVEEAEAPSISVEAAIASPV